MESISMGWSDNSNGRENVIVAKISNCRHEIATWRKNNSPYGKEKINELQKALEEVQMDNTRSQEDILEVSRKLQEAYKDETRRSIGTRKVGICDTHQGILIQSSTTP